MVGEVPEAACGAVARADGGQTRLPILQGRHLDFAPKVSAASSTRRLDRSRHRRPLRRGAKAVMYDMLERLEPKLPALPPLS